MNSGEYLELADGLKEIFEKKDQDTKKHIIKYNELYKNMVMIYGLIRIFQENDDDLHYAHYIQEIREIASSCLFEHLEDVED